MHPYIEDLEVPSNFSHNFKISDIHKVLIDKLQESMLENQLVIELTDEDFKDFSESGMIFRILCLCRRDSFNGQRRAIIIKRESW